MKKTDVWKWIGSGTILALLLLLGDNIRLRTTMNNKLDTLIENDEKQEQRWDKQDQRWNVQNEINGKFVILYDYFIPHSAGTSEEETEGQD